jgi:hypothetical protein
MAKRRVSPTETNIFETSLTGTKEKGSRFGINTARAIGGVAAGAVGTVMFFSGAGEAQADNQLVFGGRYDVNSVDYTKFLIETGQIDPKDDKIFAVPNPAGMIRQLDGTSMRETTDIAVANAQHVINTQIDRNEPTHVWGYSLGSAGALETANKNEGIVDSVTLDKSPYGPGGLSSSELAKDPEIKAMLDENGVIIKESLPTDIPVNVNSNPADIFSGGGPLVDIQAAIDGFMNTFTGPHDMSDPTLPHNVQHFGNVTVAWYGNNPLPTVTFDPAAAPEVAPVPEMPAPEMVPAPTPEVAMLVNDVAPAPEAVRSATPSTPGEVPCVDANGTEYFTPSGLPC